MLRTLSWTVAVLLVAATVLQFVDQLNLYAQPPVLPESANMVERRLGTTDYRAAIWPIFFGSHFLFALALLVVVPLTYVIGARLPRTEDRRLLMTSTLAGGALIGAIGELILIGAIQPTIGLAYCDCGFKDQEVVSQIWAAMLIEGSYRWLLNGTALMLGVGFWIAGTLLRGRGMSEAWEWLSRGIAVAFVVPVILSVVETGEEVSNLLAALVTGVLVPVWAIWLGRNLGTSTVLDA
ncbi:MAG: hypothetical protein ACAH65_03655 [Chloroflexota bacterium]